MTCSQANTASARPSSSRGRSLERIPTLEQDGLRGGVKYHDGQFDDSRLLINLAQTAAERGRLPGQLRPGDRLWKDADGFPGRPGIPGDETGARTAWRRGVDQSTGRLATRCAAR